MGIDLWDFWVSSGTVIYHKTSSPLFMHSLIKNKIHSLLPWKILSDVTAFYLVVLLCSESLVSHQLQWAGGYFHNKAQSSDKHLRGRNFTYMKKSSLVWILGKESTLELIFTRHDPVAEYADKNVCQNSVMNLLIN